ncbi:bridging integrator 3 [Hydra vulgaris]|uniref:Bridging integrator 3 n=1 Tax=Hydra vulgaris TaxID=6087 RepID=A0ABM4CD03_HYDVU
MSWIPFRKQGKKTILDKKTCFEYESNIERLNKVEASTRKVYKEGKKHLESNASLSKMQQRFAQELNVGASIKETDERLFNITQSLQQTLVHQSELLRELNNNIQKSFVDPMKKFTSNFALVNNAIKRRDQSLSEYTKYNNRREKFLEKESQSGKFDANERYLALAKADFERRNIKLMEELPKFFDCRSTYFMLCFKELVKSEHDYFSKSREIFEQLAEKVDCPIEQLTEEEYREETSKRLADIRTLSIVG